ncbi:MAG: hypothetical protein QMD04_10420 [Anaerolineales bacterium]|nr:hypothetical protein [Anaerolineales bacterium]
MNGKILVKELLGELPLTAEIDWLLRYRGKKSKSRFNLDALAEHLPEIMAQVTPHAESAPSGKKIFFFASWHYWIMHTVLSGLTLRGLGHDVTLGYLPYSDYDLPISRFNLRRQDLYARHVLRGAHPLLKIVSFLDLKPAPRIPAALTQAVERITFYDTQYTLQREEVTGSEPVYLLRRERNLAAARKAFACFQKNRPDVVVVPNGMIQEYGAVYEAARCLGIPTVTYEFGEQDQRVWLGQERLVMFHLTGELWAERQKRKLNAGQRAWLESFLAARQGITSGDKFAHLWQKTSRAGGDKVRADLGLDRRPVVLLPTNVFGDSATLGRTLFSQSIAEWVTGLVSFFANRPEVQLVIRIHPAESRSVGPSIVDTIHQAVASLPEHIRLIAPQEKVNTYDLMEIADLALVYTTTAGLEMAVRGIPVLVSGDAHYRKKGFTLDADTWDEYFAVLEAALADLPGQRLTPEQVARAWNYAYCFFAEYPRPFPWHLEKIWSSLEKRPLSYVLSPQGRAEYEATFQQMAGAAITW